MALTPPRRILAPGRRPLGVMTAAFALVAACSEPTGPAEGVRIDATTAEIHATRVMVADARTRLFPAIAALNGVAELEAAVAAIEDAVQRVNARDLEEQSRLAVSALDRVRAASTEETAADIAAIDLAIHAAAEIVAFPDGTRGNSNLRKP